MEGLCLVLSWINNGSSMNFAYVMWEMGALCSNLFPGIQGDMGFLIITDLHEHRVQVKFDIVKWVGRSKHI